MKYYENKLWCDLKNDQERVEFLLCGRAWDTNIIARAIVEDVAEAFAYRAASEFHITEQKKYMGCFVDYDPKYPNDIYSYCLLDIDKDCDKAKTKDTCEYWRAANEKA